MSSKSRRDSQEIMRVYTLLGQRVARKDRQLAETACMSPEIRELIGYIDGYNALFSSISTELEFKEEKKALMAIGRQMWPRKELTDLALRVGDNVVVAEFDDVGDDTTEETDI